MIFLSDNNESIQRILETTIPTTVTIMIYLWGQKAKARKENIARGIKEKEENDRKHKENGDKLDAINDALAQSPPHFHGERSGPLMAENIFPRR